MKLCELFEKKKDKKVKCFACSHKCLISDGKIGLCGVRKNINGELFSLAYGRVASMNVDPIEKKPLYHFMPGTSTFSIGTVGCNLKCEWCQNVDISQVTKQGIIFGQERTPEEIVEQAIENKCPSISYTYNEPTVFIEYVRDIAKLAKKKGLKNILVTNGYFTKESFDYISDYIDAMNIDLKTFSDSVYRKYCGCKLNPILETIKLAHKKGIHIEITTLVIPDLNDKKSEFEKIAKFIAKIDKNIPWHISRFFPMYKFKNKSMTPRKTLETAYKIGKKYLNNVYIGNI